MFQNLLKKINKPLIYSTYQDFCDNNVFKMVNNSPSIDEKIKPSVIKLLENHRTDVIFCDYNLDIFYNDKYLVKQKSISDWGFPEATITYNMENFIKK